MRPIHRFCSCHGQLAHDDYTDVKHTEDDGSDVQGKFASAALKELSQRNLNAPRREPGSKSKIRRLRLQLGLYTARSERNLPTVRLIKTCVCDTSATLTLL